jgi:CRISPR/Cas system-associated protein Cas5 (RAMP superfamily)
LVGVVQVAECLPGKHEALRSNTSYCQKKPKKQKNKKKTPNQKKKQNQTKQKWIPEYSLPLSYTPSPGF